MYRSVVSLLILTSLVGTVIAINPRARAEATELWEEAKPTLVAWRDKVSEVFQGFISSNGSDTQIEQNPVSPEFNFDIIITFTSSDSL